MLIKVTTAWYIQTYAREQHMENSSKRQNYYIEFKELMYVNIQLYMNKHYIEQILGNIVSSLLTPQDDYGNQLHKCSEELANHHLITARNKL